MVDAPPDSSLHCARHDKVPIGVLLRFEVMNTEQVDQSVADDLREPGELVGMVPHAAQQLGRIEDVVRLRGHVDIAHPQQLLTGILCVEEIAKLLEPFHFVLPLLGPDGVAVGNVGVEHPDSFDGRTDNAGILGHIGIAKAFGNVGHRVLGEQRDAIPRFLAVEGYFVTEFFKFGSGKLIVFDFGFLDSKNIDRILLKPLDQ